MEVLLEKFTFYSLSAVTLISAVLVVSAKDAVHSALFLGLSLAAVGGIFASMGADFLFAAQIMVYVSGIAVLILFVVMIAGRKDDKLKRQINAQWAPALGVSLLMVYALIKLFCPFANIPSPIGAEPTTMGIARRLLGDYGLPFELVSVLLMAALLGAILFSRGDRSAGKEER